MNVDIKKEYEDENFSSYTISHNNITAYFNVYYHNYPYIYVMIVMELKLRRLDIFYTFEDGVLKIDRTGGFSENNEKDIFNQLLKLSTLFLNNIKAMNFIHKLQMNYLGL